MKFNLVSHRCFFYRLRSHFLSFGGLVGNTSTSTLVRFKSHWGTSAPGTGNTTFNTCASVRLCVSGVLSSLWPEQSIYPRIVTTNLSDVIERCNNIFFSRFNKLKAKVVGGFSMKFLATIGAVESLAIYVISRTEILWVHERLIFHFFLVVFYGSGTHWRWFRTNQNRKKINYIQRTMEVNCCNANIIYFSISF